MALSAESRLLAANEAWLACPACPAWQGGTPTAAGNDGSGWMGQAGVGIEPGLARRPGPLDGTAFERWAESKRGA